MFLFNDHGALPFVSGNKDRNYSVQLTDYPSPKHINRKTEELFARAETEKPEQSRYVSNITTMNNELCMGGFREIPAEEQQHLNGGVLPFLAAVGIVAITQIILDWDNFINGLTGQPEEK
jgi:hypothetical protein